ncbi:phage integrase N-terminal SAM-like domain-containing protein [Achromobacter xylosoxidans]|uniref:phage integrase N-terminal SAM-like domain-containing protein n=1 Tax=Alcaligenes xylosoxydans xylosoxydans TaxID=85698 RepID=UPI00215AF8E7|nr:phage integrase N-terminal SAM-like domain-containing protein [Achromobacter xylosoxidans]
MRYKHYSLRTEQVYAQWARMLVKWRGLRHPRDMGSSKSKAFCSSWLNDCFGASSWTWVGGSGSRLIGQY